MEMKTNNFFEELKKYFQNTPREQILEDWARTEKFDELGPTVEEFITNTQQYHKVRLEDPLDTEVHFSNDNLSPEFTSGFFNCCNLINNLIYNAKGSLLN